ncbi:MAG: NAD-dependent protein deacylase [Roseburia sp.]|nr:NAD-dependent protein deacylase [Anaeroplasma bactoclasticum]MCM1195697.1 NAD-dependent protein deacylase [Roseburia sp.]MCM1556363.1 NAD-dependent protein deacylase [Anaeroplasma bactoclasticum]
MDKYEQLKNIIKESKRIVVFTGAGISVPSGIPDFRSSRGLYSKQYGQYSPEEIISHSFFMNKPELFYEFYGDKMVYPNAKPNLAHLYFAKLSNISAVVTQNIDGLHQAAGSKTVYELHGSVLRNYCMKCHKFYNVKDIDIHRPSYCSCGGMIKPDVVLYEEPLDDKVVYLAIDAITKADTMIVVGTSLVVYPAASYLQYFSGKHLILINKSSTSYDSKAELVFNEDVIDVVQKLEEKSI